MMISFPHLGECHCATLLSNFATNDLFEKLAAKEMDWQQITTNQTGSVGGELRKSVRPVAFRGNGWHFTLVTRAETRNPRETREF